MTQVQKRERYGGHDGGLVSIRANPTPWDYVEDLGGEWGLKEGKNSQRKGRCVRCANVFSRILTMDAPVNGTSTLCDIVAVMLLVSLTEEEFAFPLGGCFVGEMILSLCQTYFYGNPRCFISFGEFITLERENQI